MKRTVKAVICTGLAALMFAGCLFEGDGIAPAADPADSSSESQPVAQVVSDIPSAPALPDSGDGTESGMYTLVVPEGFTLPKIGMTLEEMGECTAAEFIAACQDGDFSAYALVAAQPENPNRCYKLEGYLFPATYEFAAGTAPEEIIKAMLSATEQRIAGDVVTQINASGYNTDEILTLASIIEKEAYGQESMPMISSVLHNRLASGTKLQCDVTISYVENVIKPFIDGDKDRYNEYYNTYKCDALPAGAICNPGMAAITAALNPADMNYMYFLTDADNNFYYAETWEQHVENGKKAGIDVE